MHACMLSVSVRSALVGPGIGAAGVGVGSQLDHLLEPAEDRALKLVAVIVSSVR